MNPYRDDAEIEWTPGWDWLLAVIALHGLILLPWLVYAGVWTLLPGLCSLAYYVCVFLRREVWRFALVEERVVLFEPRRRGRARRQARWRGVVWMTADWLVVRTSGRVLVLHARRYDPALFARLRRGLRRGSAIG